MTNMTHLELYRLIELPDEIIKDLELYSEEMFLDTIEKYKDALNANIPYEKAADVLTAELKPDVDGCKALYVMMSICLETYDRYVEKGIHRIIFSDTMKGFTRIITENYAANGKYFFDRIWWAGRYLNMVLFRIGMLEYEILSENGIKSISIHIPSDADLSNSDNSVIQSRAFFKKYYPECSDLPYICISWLMSPALDFVLKKPSNILNFKSGFKIIEYFPDDESYKWFVFNNSNIAPESFPENTTLQRNIKRYVLSGGKIGAARGLLI